jgi:predicted phage terminase large subunit-like protein
LYTIVLANREQDAVEFVNQTKKALENERIIRAFGQLIDKKERTVNKIECELTNNTKIQAFSSGTSIRGTKYGTVRPTLVISDDYQSEADILTEEAKNKKYGKWLKEVEESGETEVKRDGKVVKQGTKFIVIGTPLASDCFVNRLRLNFEYKTFHRSVVNFNIDEYFEEHLWWQEFKKILFNDKELKRLEKAQLYYDQNKEIMDFDTIWSKYSCFDIAIKYFSKRNEFLQELMCDCENVGQKWVTNMCRKTTEEIEDNKFKKTMLTVDPATSNSSIKNSDYSAFCVGSLGVNNFKYVREGILKKLGFNDYIKEIIALLKKYKDITHVVIEKNVYLGADVTRLTDVIKEDKELKSRNINFVNEMQRKNKDLKIGAIIDDINAGSVVFNKDNAEFNQQVLDFSGQKTSLHDDAIDAVAEFIIKIDEIKVIEEIKVYDNWFLYR